MTDIPTAIVMGTAQYDGRPSRQFAARLEHAAALFRAGQVRGIVTVGGNKPGDRFTEAEAGALYLERRSIPAAAITRVPSGTDTRTSVRAVRGSVDTRERYLIVSDPTHVLRATLLARLEGLRARPSACTQSPVRRFSRHWWYQVLHETGGLAVIGVRVVAGERCARRAQTRLRGWSARIRPRRRANRGTVN